MKRAVLLLVLIQACLAIGCKLGDEWIQDCNRCTCSDDGVAICTKRLCGINPITNVKVRRDLGPVSSSTLKPCESGTAWRESCNTCLCYGGLPLCSKVLCEEDFEQDKTRLEKRAAGF